jgi:hypothetical protein
MTPELRKKFFEDTDNTGRHMIVSLRTGKRYFIEPIGDPHIKWGSIDPATGNLMNKKGAGKYKGSIDEKDSLITEENGFKNIKVHKPGVSPYAYIDELDAQYPDKE